MMPCYIRTTHAYGFRPGQWALVTDVIMVLHVVDGKDSYRPCFLVRFIDGITDEWPIHDPDAKYEFTEDPF